MNQTKPSPELTVTPEITANAGIELRALMFTLGLPREQTKLHQGVVPCGVGLLFQLLNQRCLGMLDLHPRERNASTFLVDGLQNHADRPA